MVYDPTIDFVGLWRRVLNGVEKAELPGLDFVVAALGRAGIINVVFSEIAPTVNQSTTAWFRTAHPSYAAEGALYLWDARLGAYVPATPELFFMYLMLSSQDDLLAIYAVTGPPPDTLGKNGDYAIRLDSPGGIYGPKAGGHWPLQPLPGTSYSQISAFLDWLGTEQGSVLYRGGTQWDTLPPGSMGQFLHTNGSNSNPYWGGLSTGDLDGLLGTGVWGDIIYRDNTHWTRLPASTNGYLLTTHGASANPSWLSASSVFDLNFPGAPVGSIIYRDTSVWWYLPPGPLGYVLESGGAGGFPFWNSTAALVGPQGPAGPTGATGPQGPQGPQGIPGAAGGGSAPGFQGIGSSLTCHDGSLLAVTGSLGVGTVTTFASSTLSGHLVSYIPGGSGSGGLSTPPGNWQVMGYLTASGGTVNTICTAIRIS